MRKYDFVRLTKERSKYIEAGIKRGTVGIVLDKLGSQSYVMFLNPHNQGDFAGIYVADSDLEYMGKSFPESMMGELKNFIAKGTIYKHESFCLPKFKEYDLVSLKKDYPKQGLKAGMTGTIFSSYSVKGYYQVNFEGETHLENGIAWSDDILACIKEEDLNGFTER